MGKGRVWIKKFLMGMNRVWVKKILIDMDIKIPPSVSYPTLPIDSPNLYIGLKGISNISLISDTDKLDASNTSLFII
jgi:hypothetical protein